MTAPHKTVGKDYEEMKKLIPGKFQCKLFFVKILRSFSNSLFIASKEQIQKKLADEKIKKFYESLKNTKPYYNTVEWEKDYKKQV